MNRHPIILLAALHLACAETKPDALASTTTPAHQSAVPTPAATASGNGAVEMTAEQVAAKITALSGTERELPEEARGAVLDELARAITRSREDGGTDRLRLFGVRPDGLLGKLGLENGDKLEALDDRALVTDAQARDAIARARGAKSFALKIVRRGAPTTLVYTVR